MILQFWGAARTVTGSMHLVHVNGRKLLLDCGMYQGKRKIAFERNRNLPFDARSIDAVVLSHAHIDHSGNLPSLVKAGFKGSIFCTSATRDLCAYMLLDSAHIQENDVKYVNKRRMKRGEKPFEPLYTREDAEETLDRFVTVPFHRPFSPIRDVQASFIFAGHIMGAASVILDIDDRGGDLEGNGARREPLRKRLVFSGDIGRDEMPIIKDPEIPEGAQYLIMESTYGNRDHEAKGEAKEALLRIVQEKAKAGGKLLIPAFAVGRTQELIYRLNQLRLEGRLPRIDVYVDSPLAINATDVLRLHPEVYDDEMRKLMRTDEDHDPLGFDRLHYFRSAQDSMTLNELAGPAVIISASGMLEGGRILHHLIHHAGDPDTTILFVGYQGQQTLGRRVLEGINPIRVYGEEMVVRAEIEKINGYSAHADHDGLMDWAVRTRDAGSLQHTFLVHGDEEPAMALAGDLRAQGLGKVSVPERGQIFEL
jgi:metallo-beta-lactamase family protein